jgi:hypothetical protein
MNPNVMTPMIKTQIYFSEEDLAALHEVGRRSNKSVAQLVREAVRKVWLRRAGRGPVALWDRDTEHSSAEHDSIYDNP